MTAMNQKPNQSIDPTQTDALLQQWRSRHNTPEKMAAAHRKVLLERVSQSMAFESQPASQYGSSQNSEGASENRSKLGPLV